MGERQDLLLRLLFDISHLQKKQDIVTLKIYIYILGVF